MKWNHWVLLLACSLIGAGLLILFGCGHDGLFGIFKSPDPNASAEFNGATLTPFARDMRALCIPVVWVCIVGGIVALIASRWVPVVSAKTAGIAIACGFGLLFSMNFLIRFEWVVDALVWVCIGSLGLMVVHWVYNKIRGVDGAEPSHLFPAFVRNWFSKPSTGA